MKPLKCFSIFALTIFISFLFLIKTTTAQEYENFTINNHCIGNVCIGDTIEKIKNRYQNYVIKVNDSNSGYYIFDPSGTFLIEFSTKQPIDTKNSPIRYIMTSNPNYCFDNEEINLEKNVSDLMKKYGNPIYENGPNGYFISFPDWPIKSSSKYNDYLVNVIVGIHNPKLSELFNFSGTMNEKAELNVLKEYPENTFLNTIEIYSDHYENGEPIN